MSKLFEVALSDSITELSGQPITEGGKPMLMHRVVANALSQAKGEPMKLYDLAHRLYAEPVIRIDQSDLETIKRAMEEAPLIPLVKVPILRAIEKAIVIPSRDTIEKPAQPSPGV